ncbi:MAG: cobalamin biosynthesis protein CobQ [Oscillospiraceae bacterium]|nr:cobalamin biosynthesis protein CobQ [Oscillospiraceae bacterium]
MNKLTIGWMYPDILNLHGERGSVQALARTAERLGLEAQVVRVADFDDEIPFDRLDLLLFLPGELKTLAVIREALRPQEARLRQYVEDGGTVVAIGTSGLIFGREILRLDGSKVEGFGLLDLTAKEREYVWGDDLHVCLRENRQELIGSQVQMADVETSMPLGRTLYGRGNKGDGAEGARYRNLIYTNCLGPLFVKNPWFAEELVKNLVLRHLGLKPGTADELAQASFDTTLRFLNSKKKP